MPRNYTPKETYTPLTPSNRVVERMKETGDLIKAERKEKISYDQAQAEANKVADDALLAYLEKLTGPEANLELAKDLLGAKFKRVPIGKPDQGEWRKSGILLKSPEGKKKFPREARRLALMDKMRRLRMTLDGGAFVKLTFEGFRLATRIAFEAGVSFAESERTKNTGRPKNDEFTDALNTLFKSARENCGENPSVSQIYAQIPVGAVDLIYFGNQSGEKKPKVISTYTIWRKIGEWLKQVKQSHT